MRETIGVCLLLALAAGCGTTREIRGVETRADVDRTYTRFSYIEDGDLVTLVANTKPTRYREEADFLPLEIGLANRGLRQLTLTRESFTLVDEGGQRYPVVTPRELLEGYPYLEMDQEVRELRNILPPNKFAAMTRYPSNFSPNRAAAGRIVRDRVSLPKFGYLLDMLYFPTPPGGVLDKKFELIVTAPELEDPIFVKFWVEPD